MVTIGQNLRTFYIDTYLRVPSLRIADLFRDCVLLEVGAEFQETFEHRALSIVKVEYRRLRRDDCKVAAYDNTMVIDCDCLEDMEI